MHARQGSEAAVRLAVPMSVWSAGGGDAATAMTVDATSATACTVTPSAAVKLAGGVATSDVAAALAAAWVGYVIVAVTDTEAEVTLSVIRDGSTPIRVARAFLNAFRLKLDTSPTTVKVAVMTATKRASGDKGGRGGDGGGGDGDGGGGEGDGGGGQGGGGGG